MTIEKNIHGALVISAVIGGYLISRQYYGYTRREAVRLFRDEVRGAK
jgi:hypothetical protein